jgi:hypothetical protein
MREDELGVSAGHASLCMDVVHHTRVQPNTASGSNETKDPHYRFGQCADNLYLLDSTDWPKRILAAAMISG